MSLKKIIAFFILSMLASLSFAMPVDKAITLQVKSIKPEGFVINWQLNNNTFLYANRLHINSAEASKFFINWLRLPKAQLKSAVSDSKKIYVYRKFLQLPVAVKTSNAGVFNATLTYQGCTEEGFCYPPQTRNLELTFDNNKLLKKVVIKDQQIITPRTNSTIEIFDKSWPLLILGFFSLGILLSFTPCVLPMIPVLSSIIVGQGADITPRRAFLLSLSYVLSMALTYALFGILIASIGSNLQIVFQSFWVIIAFSFIFVLLALSMFGVYELKLPLLWQNKLANISSKQKRGQYIGAAIMGCLSTLVLSACITAPLIGVLAYIAHTGDIFLGSVALFFLGLGMGAPLLIIGASAGKLLPKAGLWMNTIKELFGFILLAVAVYLLERVISGFASMVLWAVLLILIGVYSFKSYFWQRALSIVLITYGILILIGGSMGNTNPIQPLQVGIHKFENKITISSLEELRETLGQVKGRAVILDFYADWCSSCKVMERKIFQNPEIQKDLREFVIIKADLTANNMQTKQLMQYFNVVGPPTFVFLDKKGVELKNLRIVGEVSLEIFVNHLSKLIYL